MCDTIVIVERGRVLFAKNSDRDANEAQTLEWQPCQTYPSEATLRCTWIEIPQARETHAIMISRPFWMWGAEIGTNEHGVVIGNEAVFTRQPYAKTGLTGMDLVRLALERADTADCACTVIAGLLAQHGQGGGGGHENRDFTYHNSFLIADPKGAFVFETAAREWAVRPIEHTYTISNGLTIPGFAEDHSDRLYTAVSACHRRQARTQALAERVESVRDLFAILRDHGEGNLYPRYSWINGGMAAPCMHASGLVAASQTTASWVSELSANGIQHWVTATAAPCTSLFKPVYVHRPLNMGPVPTDVASPSLWWQHECFHRFVMRNPQRFFPLFQDERDAIEAHWTKDPPDALQAFVEHGRLLDRWMEKGARDYVRDVRPIWVRHYWERRSSLAGL